MTVFIHQLTISNGYHVTKLLSMLSTLDVARGHRTRSRRLTAERVGQSQYRGGGENNGQTKNRALWNTSSSDVADEEE